MSSSSRCSIVKVRSNVTRVAMPSANVSADSPTTRVPERNERVKGLHRHPVDSSPGDPQSSWLHVSAGLGTSPYAPVRFACPPEATLLTLTARRSGFGGAPVSRRGR